jgi:hypothetical protein
MWLWEKYELFPSETVADPHLFGQLASQVQAAGGNVDAALFSRYDQCVGRVLQRLTDEFPYSVDGLDEAELKHWLKFGLRHDVRGHDEAITPIIDADSLINFRFFVTHALQFAARHNRGNLQELWQKVADIAKQVDDEHQGARPSRFGNVKLADSK